MSYFSAASFSLQKYYAALIPAADVGQRPPRIGSGALLAKRVRRTTYPVEVQPPRTRHLCFVKSGGTGVWSGINAQWL